MEKRELQLFDSLSIDPLFVGVTVMEAIEANPYAVESLCDAGQITLAAGASRYLKETLREWVEFDVLVREEQSRGRL